MILSLVSSMPTLLEPGASGSGAAWWYQSSARRGTVLRHLEQEARIARIVARPFTGAVVGVAEDEGGSVVSGQRRGGS